MIMLEGTKARIKGMAVEEIIEVSIPKIIMRVTKRRVSMQSSTAPPRILVTVLATAQIMFLVILQTKLPKVIRTASTIFYLSTSLPTSILSTSFHRLLALL